MYTRNDLNQYTHVYRYGDPQAALFPDYDEDGNLSALEVAGDMNCNGVVNTLDITPFTLALMDPAAYQQQYPDCDIMQADLNGDGLVNNFDIDYFMQAAGNVGVKYEWDAENRLTRVGPLRTPLSGDVEVRFAYDYLGRRIEKIVSEYRTTPTAGWYETSRRRYVWAGWLMLLELDRSNNIVRKYTWGLDLAGQNGQVNSLEAAGGIGGLLAVEDTNGTPGTGGDDLKYVYTYDGNGNVAQVLDWSATSATASIKAKYEYDPYGNLTRPLDQCGDYADDNPFRFSTKYWDDETGLGYWGYRYYSPRMGRWISRDPLEEESGINLYSYLDSQPLALIDPLGERQYSYEFNLRATGTGFSFYMRGEFKDTEPCCAEVSVFAAGEWQPPFLHWVEKPFDLVNVHVEAGLRGGIKTTAKLCMGMISSLKVCGRFEAFARAEYRHQRFKESGPKKRITRGRFGIGADGGVDLCWDLCSGAVIIAGQVNAWAYVHFGWKWFNRSYSTSWEWASGETQIATVAAPLKKYCCLLN